MRRVWGRSLPIVWWIARRRSTILRQGLLVAILLLWWVQGCRVRSRIPAIHWRLCSVLPFPDRELSADIGVQIVIFFKLNVLGTAASFENGQSNLPSVLINAPQFAYCKDALHYLSPDDSLLAQPWGYRKNVDSDTTSRERFLYPRQEISIQKVQRDDLDFRDIVGAPAR